MEETNNELIQIHQELSRELESLNSALADLAQKREVEDAAHRRVSKLQRIVNESLQNVLDAKLHIMKSQDILLQACLRALDARALCIDTMWISMVLATPEQLQNFQERICEEGIPRHLELINR